MVESIAAHTGVECPSLFGSILSYFLPALMPIFALIWFRFFRWPPGSSLHPQSLGKVHNPLPPGAE